LRAFSDQPYDLPCHRIDCSADRRGAFPDRLPDPAGASRRRTSLGCASVHYPTMGKIERFDSELERIYRFTRSLSSWRKGSNGRRDRSGWRNGTVCCFRTCRRTRFTDGTKWPGCPCCCILAGIRAPSTRRRIRIERAHPGRQGPLGALPAWRPPGSATGAGRRFRTLAAYYKFLRFNSPNDLVYHPNGDLYFTDPTYGLEQGVNDPRRELMFSGVFRLHRTARSLC
jgi:hypothetical protein